MGAKNIGFVDTSRTFFHLFEFRLEMGEFEKEVKKRYRTLFVVRPQVSLTIYPSSIIFSW